MENIRAGSAGSITGYNGIDHQSFGGSIYAIFSLNTNLSFSGQLRVRISSLIFLYLLCVDEQYGSRWWQKRFGLYAKELTFKFVNNLFYVALISCNGGVVEFYKGDLGLTGSNYLTMENIAIGANCVIGLLNLNPPCLFF